MTRPIAGKQEMPDALIAKEAEGTFDAKPASPISAAETWMDIGAEVADFYANRLRENVNAQHRLLHCRNPAEFMGIEVDFAVRAFDDYHREAGRLAEMSRRVLPRQLW